MSGMMEVPVTPPRGKGPAMAKGLLVLLGVSALLVPWGTAEAKPSSLVFDTDGEAPAAPPPAPPNAPLVSVGNPLDMCPPWAPGLGFMVRATPATASACVTARSTASLNPGLVTSAGCGERPHLLKYWGRVRHWQGRAGHLPYRREATRGASEACPRTAPPSGAGSRPLSLRCPLRGRDSSPRPALRILSQLVFKNIVPIVMAGVLSIYGMIIGVIIASGVTARSK